MQGMYAFDEKGQNLLHLVQMFSLDSFKASTTPRTKTYNLPAGATIVTYFLYANSEQMYKPPTITANSVSWTYDSFHGDYTILVMCKM